MNSEAPPGGGKAGPGRSVLAGLGLAWALLLAFGILSSLREMVPRIPWIFKGAETRARLESGDDELHSLVSDAAALSRTEPRIVALTNDEENFLFIDYRLDYLLYPTRVSLFLADFIPPHPHRFGVNVSDPVMDMIVREKIRMALFLARGRPELSGCFAVRPVSNGLVSFTRLKGDAGMRRGGAKRWYFWPLGLASIFLLGFAVLRLTRFGPPASVFCPGVLALCFLAGLGLVAWFMVLLSIAGIRWSLPVLCVPWVILGGWALFSRRDTDGTNGSGGPLAGPDSWMNPVGKGLVAAAVLLAALKVAIPMSAWSNWDAWAVWGMKARVFWEAGGVPFPFLRDEFYAFSHHEYPPGFPAIQAYLAFFSGGLDERLLRLISPVFGLALAFLTAALAARLGLVRTRWLLAGLTVCGFRFLEQAGNGYADLPVACGMTACFLVLAMVYRGETRAWAVGFFGGVLGLIKPEGLIWAGGCLAVALVWTFTRKVRVREFAAALLVFAALSAPWKGISAHLGLKPIDYRFDFVRLVRGVPDRAPVIFKGAVLNILGPGATMATMEGENVANLGQWWGQFRGGWPLLWWFAFACLYLGRRSLQAAPLRELGAVILLQLCAYSAVYLVSLQDLQWHIVTSMDRLLLQLAPCLLVLAAAAARNLMEPERV